MEAIGICFNSLHILLLLLLLLLLSFEEEEEEIIKSENTSLEIIIISCFTHKFPFEFIQFIKKQE
jgi:hypothetical protein